MTNLKKYIYLFSIALSFCIQANAQSVSGEEQAYKNQFEKVFASDRADSLKFQFILDNLNNLNARGSEYPIIYAKKGIALAQQKKATKWNGLLQVELGWIYQGINKINEAEIAYLAAIDIFEKLNLKVEKAKAHGKLSLLYGQTNRQDKALFEAKTSAQIAESIGDEKGIAYAYYAMVYSFNNSGKDRQALEYIDKSIDLYQKNGEIYRMAVVMQNKVTTYMHLGEQGKALAAANELIQTIKNNTGQKNEATDTYYIGQALFSRAKVYMQLGEFENALADNDSLQVLLSNNGTALVDAVYIFQKAKILHYTKQFKDSKDICLKLLKHPTVEEERFLGYTYDLLSKNYVELNQFKSAYKYHLEAENFENREIAQKAKFNRERLEEKYEAEKNAATIEVQRQTMRTQHIIQWSIIGFAGVLGLLLLQTFRNAKTRKENNAALRLSNNQLGESNALLAEKNKENELLLKEIHHRVKNNLEIVSSLLELQADRVTDKASQNILKDSQNRVQSMGIIHQKLYLAGNLNSVEMLDYFKNLSESILETFNAWDKMDIEIDMKKTILDVEVAIPIGLIVNELVTNSWKYAFPNTIFKNEKGKIKIKLTEIDTQSLQLIVSDNGIGKHPAAPIQGTGFGSQLIRLLTQQLNGQMSEVIDNGTTFIFDFKLNS